jgi:hypothetical protein
MSESQERMMAFVEPRKVDEVLAVADKWEIDARVVGTVTAGDILRIRHDGELVAEVPAASLSEAAPRYDRPLARTRLAGNHVGTTHSTTRSRPTWPTLLRAPRRPVDRLGDWAYEQYDHMLFLNTVVGPGQRRVAAAGEGTDKGLAVSTDGNGRLCYLDPFRGGRAPRLRGGAQRGRHRAPRPMAVVDNLNFGNPEKPEVMWQFRQCIEGISAACEHLGIPVVGGNVSFYNETDGVDIHPTPVVGLLGKAEPMPTNPPRLDAGETGWSCGCSDPMSRRPGRVGVRARDPRPPRRPTGTRRSGVASAVIALAVRLAAKGRSRPARHLRRRTGGGSGGGVHPLGTSEPTVRVDDWRQLFSEAPHRLVAAVHRRRAIGAAMPRRPEFRPVGSGLLGRRSSLRRPDSGRSRPSPTRPHPPTTRRSRAGCDAERFTRRGRFCDVPFRGLARAHGCARRLRCGRFDDHADDSSTTTTPTTTTTGDDDHDHHGADHHDDRRRAEPGLPTLSDGRPATWVG